MANVVPFPARDAPRGLPLGDRSDDELMLLVRAGGMDALAVLVARHAARLSRFCTRFLGDASLADEVCQTVWLRIWASHGSYRAEGKFFVVLFTIARNTCRNQARAARRRERWLPSALPEALDDVADPRTSQLDRLIERERQLDLLRALDALPEAMREAVLLRFQEELTYEDIAKILDTSESTLRSRVHYGLKELRRHLAKGGSR